MTILLTIFHVMACLMLILVILLQVGRGHGLSGTGFGQGGVQTVFGTRAADFLNKATSVMAIVFILTCISLDIIYSRKGRSLFEAKQPLSQMDLEKIKEALEKIQKEEVSSQQPAAPVTETPQAEPSQKDNKEEPKAEVPTPPEKGA